MFSNVTDLKYHIISFYHKFKSYKNMQILEDSETGVIELLVALDI